MTIDDLKKVLEGSDLSAVLPDLSKIVDSLAPIMKIALMAGPIILLVYACTESQPEANQWGPAAEYTNL